MVSPGKRGLEPAAGNARPAKRRSRRIAQQNEYDADINEIAPGATQASPTTSLPPAHAPVSPVSPVSVHDPRRPASSVSVQDAVSPASPVSVYDPVSAEASELTVRRSYEVCFGVLLVNATCLYRRWDPPPDTAPVQITRVENRLVLTYEGSGKQAGLLISEPLARVIRDHSVRLVAMLGPCKSRPSDVLGLESLKVDGMQTRPLRIVFYGLMSQGNAVADTLGDAGIFFQRPELSEYDRNVKYHNPMYLLPPGEEMPRVLGDSTAASARGQSPNHHDEDQLGEVDKARVFRIFDEATGADGAVAVHVKQSSRIVSELKDHQLQALAMMVERENDAFGSQSKFPLLWETSGEGVYTRYKHIVTGETQRNPPPSLHGGILADEMGLGKTLSTLALICHHVDGVSDRSSTLGRPSSLRRATLIVTPMSTIYGWQQQIEKHIRPGGVSLFLFHGSKRHDAATKLHDFDIVLTTYDTLRSDWGAYGPLYTQTWARIILDEAHKIRNQSSQIFQAACELPAHNRWCLTGTPIQNTLDDYGALLAFVGVPPFTTRHQFRFWITSPIATHQPKALRAVRALVRATCLRRTKAHPALAATLSLPGKVERMEIVDLAPGDRELYDFFKRRSYLLAGNAAAEAAKVHEPAPRKDGACSGASGRQFAKSRRRQPANKGKRAGGAIVRRNNSGNIVVLISVLRMICDHGAALLPRTALEAWQKRDATALSWDVLQTVAGTGRRCCLCGRVEDVDEVERRDNPGQDGARKVHFLCEGCAAATASDDATLVEGGSICPKCRTAVSSAESPLPSGPGAPGDGPSSKVTVLLRNVLATLQKGRGDDPPVKSVIFSHWTGMLDLMAKAFDQPISDLGFFSVRIDGGCSLQQRRDALDKFNSNDNCVIMLASVGAVGEGHVLCSLSSVLPVFQVQYNKNGPAESKNANSGDDYSVDLSVASDIHIVEPHWNPMAEAQAVDRVHRIGQAREVNITRYCVKDSIEEYIQWVQERKLKLISESLSYAEDGEDGKETAEEKLLEERWTKLLKFLS